MVQDRTVKYLYVLSRPSNHKLGVLRELRIANTTAKKEGFKDFVIPLRIDDLSHDDINIELGRLNAVEFTDWAAGLKQLLKKLEEDSVPRSPFGGPEIVRRWWEREFTADNGVTNEPEVHYSNWFRVQLPDRFYRHSFMGLMDREPAWSFPTCYQALRLQTFAPAAEVTPGLGTLKIHQTETFETPLFLSEEGADRQSRRNIVTELLTDAWDRFAVTRGLKKYEMASGRIAYYFDLDALPSPNVAFVGVDGAKTHRGLMGFSTRKKGDITTKRHWHFAVSVKPAVHPQTMFQMRAHVLFSDDGRNIWSSTEPKLRDRMLRAMHRARRTQCKSWWNDEWRDRILATMAWLASDAQTLNLMLSESSAVAAVDARPLEFLSPVTLLEPSRGAESEADIFEDDEEDEDDDSLEGGTGADAAEVEE